MSARRDLPPDLGSDVAPAAAPDSADTPDAEAHRVGGIDYSAFDHLATLVAVVEPDGHCVFANSVLEAVVGVARRKLVRGSIYDWFRGGAAGWGGPPGGARHQG